MAGIERDTPIPTDIKLHQKSRFVELIYESGDRHELDYEFLRVFTPSAEARGHGPGQETLQTGKRDVGISQIEMVGHYAVQPTFTDGHDTGLFTWGLLYKLGSEQADLWARYEQRLADAGVTRDTPMPPKAGSACASH